MYICSPMCSGEYGICIHNTVGLAIYVYIAVSMKTNLSILLASCRPVPFQGASRLSTPSPTFEFSPTSAHLSVLNILSDSDSSVSSMAIVDTVKLQNCIYI